MGRERERERLRENGAEGENRSLNEAGRTITEELNGSSQATRKT